MIHGRFYLIRSPHSDAVEVGEYEAGTDCFWTTGSNNPKRAGDFIVLREIETRTKDGERRND